ncbi:MAG: hypothetical protein CMP09_06030 [Yangia sp.]|nr:hypothetical protein [Salipiger sp.]
MAVKPTDQQILAAVAKHSRHGEMTYVVRNILAMDHGFRGLKTDFVRRRLKAMERAGLVKQVPSQHFATQLCWAVAAPPEEKEGME